MRGRGGWRAGALAGALTLLVAEGLAPSAISFATPESLASRLAAEAASGTAVSVAFLPLGWVGEKVEFNQDLPLPPASVQKIVTSAAALDLLGPDHQFETRILAGAPIRDGILEGDLIVQGGGDPFLVSERLWLLAQEVAATGLRAVTGALVIDARPVGDLDSLRLAEGTDSPYAAPVSSLGVNFNSVSFLVRPGERVGDEAAVAFEPFPISTYSLVGAVRTVSADSTPPEIETLLSSDGGIETITVRGAVRLGEPPRHIYRASRRPDLLAGGILEGLLQERGITIGRGVKSGRAPQGSRLVVAFPSLSLGILVRSMNLWSNNYMADLLLAGLGDDWTAASGARRVGAWWLEHPRLGPAPKLVDGCGLSASNRISAGQIAAVLAWAATREQLFPDLYASFPRPGGEGTLARRFRDAPAPALRAKTGTLGDHGVSSIAGYVDAAGGRRYAFCILQQASRPGGLRVADLREREEAWLREFVAP